MGGMKLNVQKVAKLANLQITKDEETTFEKQLSDVLDYIGLLDEVDTKDVKPTSQVTGLENVTQEDEARSSLPQEAVLANTKNGYNGSFKVKAILEI
jgi:aspartyl-tRNA(Asn)/glutamyl-tRNA(Gln) amidotransferase subunit C